MYFKDAVAVVVIAAVVFGVTFGVGRIVSAFTEPSQAPPAGNTPPPINVGSSAQTKSGSINAIGGLLDDGVSVCRSDGKNCPGSLTGKPTVLRYQNPRDRAVLGPADICSLESFGATTSKDNGWCILRKNGDLYTVRRTNAVCTFVCLRW